MGDAKALIIQLNDDQRVKSKCKLFMILIIICSWDSRTLLYLVPVLPWEVYCPLYFLEARNIRREDSDIHQWHNLGISHKALFEQICPEELRVEPWTAEELVQESHPLFPHWIVQHNDSLTGRLFHAASVQDSIQHRQLWCTTQVQLIQGERGKHRCWKWSDTYSHLTLQRWRSRSTPDLPAQDAKSVQYTQYD